MASLTSGLPNEQRISDMGHNDCIQVSLLNLGLQWIFTSILNFSISNFQYFVKVGAAMGVPVPDEWTCRVGLCLILSFNNDFSIPQLMHVSI